MQRYVRRIDPHATEERITYRHDGPVHEDDQDSSDERRLHLGSCKPLREFFSVQLWSSGGSYSRQRWMLHIQIIPESMPDHEHPQKCHNELPCPNECGQVARRSLANNYGYVHDPVVHFIRHSSPKIYSCVMACNLMGKRRIRMCRVIALNFPQRRLPTGL